MNTYTTFRTRHHSLRFCTLLLALMGLLLLGAKSSQAAEEIYFNTLNPKTGAIVKSWKIDSFGWGASNANQQVPSFNMMWDVNAAAKIIMEAGSTKSPIAAASITFHSNGKQRLTYKFTHLQVTSVWVAGGDAPTEGATLTYQEMSVFYHP